MIIYLIGQTGAAQTTSEAYAKALETLTEYQRCTKAEYHDKLTEIQALDTASTEGEIDQ